MLTEHYFEIRLRCRLIEVSEGSTSRKDFYVGWFHSSGDAKDRYFVYADVFMRIYRDLLSSFATADHMLRGHDYGIIPPLFLFRHYIELQLKGLLIAHGGESMKTHDLDILLEKLLKVNQTNPHKLSREVKNFITSLGRLDKNSDGFRYPYTNDGKAFFSTISKPQRKTLESINSLELLFNASEKVMDELEVSEGYFYTYD
jgi:HEPN domain-containing protein